MNRHVEHDANKALSDRAIRTLIDRIGRRPAVLAQAPGRVNLIGEHTDYNDGFVLPMAVDRRTVLVAAPNGTRTARLFASDLISQQDEIPLNRPVTPGKRRWANYVRGVLAQFAEAGHTLPGFDAAIASSIPMGGGLSSSAALEVAAALAVQRLLGVEVEPMRIARWCQTAERDFAGLPCGIMDQMASVFGRTGHALRIDCRTLEIQPVPLDTSELAVLVTDSRVEHELAGSEYALRREQCQRAIELLRKNNGRLEALRDVTPAMLHEHEARMEATIRRRARHVVEENQRVGRFAEALGRGAGPVAGALMHESHASLRDEYEVSCPELDLLVRLAGEIDGVFGSRMTGGGFGGCTVTLLRPDAVEPLIAHLQRRYHEQTGREPSCFRVHPAAGATVESL